MESNIVLVHAGLAVLFVLYLLLRMIVSVFGVNDAEYQAIMRRKFRIPDYCFVGLILATGLYPIFILGTVELYHIIKILFLALLFWTSRISKMNYVGASFLGFVLLVVSGYSSFNDSPKFPRPKSSFEKDHPEILTLSPIERGKMIFNTICSECHGLDGKKGLFQAADLTTSKLTFDKKIEMVKNGSPLTVMRSFANELSEEEINAVVQYVQNELSID